MSTNDLVVQERDGEKFVFFWKGWISNWALTPFVLQVSEASASVAHLRPAYQCVEQYMMAMKANFFGDLSSEAKIMASTSPAEQKRLGRLVKGYDDKKWSAVREHVVLVGTLNKYAQHPDLRERLLSTGDATLVEANPNDMLWGIGMGADDSRLFDKSKWGKNLLGKVLMKARGILREDATGAQAEGRGVYW